MKKIFFFIPVVFLILATTVTKNSTKHLDNKIFEIKENIRVLKDKYELEMLEYNYLSSPKKLIEYQKKYFENELVEAEIENFNWFNIENSNIYIPNTNMEKKIPSFELKSFQDNSNIISEKIFNGNNYYLMNIWASWCIPCRSEHSMLMSLSKKTDLNIIGLNYKDKKNNAVKFLDELGDPFSQNLIDPDGIISISLGAYGVPESILLNNKSKVIRKYIGPLTSDNISEIIKIIQ